MLSIKDNSVLQLLNLAWCTQMASGLWVPPVPLVMALIRAELAAPGG
jgi:hypothetical protein